MRRQAFGTEARQRADAPTRQCGGSPRLAKAGPFAGLDSMAADAHEISIGCLLLRRAVGALKRDGGRDACRRGALEPTTGSALIKAGAKLCGPNSIWVGAYSEMAQDLGSSTLPEWLRRIPARAAIVLHRWEKDYGHWICCFLQGDGRLQIFDSTGRAPDELRRQQSEADARALGQDRRRMVQALHAGARLIPAYYNDARLQRRTSQTCGRWCILRLALRNLSEDEFTSFVGRCCRLLSCEPDTFCVAATC